MDFTEFKAKTVDEAITQACLKYGVTSDRLEFDVIEEGRAGFFGIGSRDAVIKARVRTPKEEQKEAEAIRRAEKKDELLKKAPQNDRPVQKRPEKKAEKNVRAARDEKAAEKKVQKAAEKAVEKTEGKTAEKNTDKKTSKAPFKAAEKAVEKKAPKPAEKPAEKKVLKPAEKPVEKKVPKTADQKEKAEAPKAAFKKNVGGIVTSDEIEKRAAAAAARAKAEGIDVNDESEREERPRRKDRRDRRDKRGGRNDRRGRDSRRDRRDSFSERKAPVKEASKTEHKPSVPKPDRVVLPKTEEEVAAMKETARTFLENVFRCMNVNVEMSMEYDQKEGCLGCTFAGEEMGILIGKRGQTLDSLQYLTSLVINKNKSDYTRVKLDTEDYRARRADTLENLSRNIAYKVKRTRKPVELEPMNPYERRIIHSSLQGNRYVETYSEGEEPYRHVVVAPKRR